MESQSSRSSWLSNHTKRARFTRFCARDNSSL